MSAGVEYIAPRNETEKEMVGVWEDVLNKRRIGILDNFFESGGDSIKVLRMLVELRKRIGLKIPPVLVYRYTTIKGLAAYIAGNTLKIEETNTVFQEKKRVVEEELDALKSRVLASSTAMNELDPEDIYPMSDIEKGMLFGSLLHDNTSVYHIQVVYQQTFFDFSPERFQRAVDLLVVTHPILRTSFNLTDFETELQIVHKQIDTRISYTDLSAGTAGEQSRWVEDFLRCELENPFIISRAPLWRMNLLKLGESRFGLVWQFHHAIMDGWSNAVFITELNNLYLRLGDGQAYIPMGLKATYKDFIVQQLIERQDANVIQFWQQEMAGYGRLDLFTQEEEFVTFCSELDGVSLEKMKRLATEWHTTVKVISLSAYIYMLKLLSYESEVVTGLLTNNRPDCEDGERMLGCFLNTIPLRIDVDGSENSAHWVKRVNEKMIELKANDRLSLIENARANKKEEGSNPFSDTLFSYMDFYVYEDVEVQKTANRTDVTGQGASLSGGRVRTNSYLDFLVSLTAGNFLLSIRLNKKLKSRLTIEEVSHLYFKILKYIIESPDGVLDDMELLRPAEKQRLLVDPDQSATVHTSSETVVGIFEEQAARTPDAIALAFGEKELTYRELDQKANRLANYLLSKYAIRPGDLVGILLNRSEKMIIALLGILKSGGAYVAIDADTSQVRKEFIIKDTGLKALITQREYLGVLPDNDERIFLADSQLDILSTPAEPPCQSIRPEDLGYVVYTSGSTGQPKGVMIDHGALVDYFHGILGRANIRECKSFGLVSTIAADLGYTVIYPALLTGGTLKVFSETDVMDPDAMLGSPVDCLKIVPSHWKALQQAERLFVPAKCLLFGGEKLTRDVIDLIRSKAGTCNVYNHYGPSETTIGKLLYAVDISNESETIPLGTPFGRTYVYILSTHVKPVPVGIAGEICIGGEGIARGYWNRPDLTSERFIADPVRRGKKIYRTGDLGRLLPDGNIEFIGRIDDQVKIRGYRIEPEEIRTHLQNHPKVDSALVMARSGEGGEKELVGYIVSKEGVSDADLRLFLENSLASYMVPAYFVFLDEMPLTPNGKADRKKIAAMDVPERRKDIAYTAPGTLLEKQLVKIWEEVLGKERIGVKDNFFELGGDSLKAIKLAKQITDRTGLVLPIRALLAERTIKNLASYLDTATGGASLSPAATREGEPTPTNHASFNQLVYFSKWKVADKIVVSHYELEEVDLPILQSALSQLVERHEVLRTVFYRTGEGVMQRVLPMKGLELKIAGPYLLNFREDIQKIIEEESSKTIDLYSFPLFFGKIYKEVNGKCHLVFTNHHIISDGYSAEIIKNELTELYRKNLLKESPQLPRLPFQYKDFSAWQRAFIDSPDGRKHREYWLGRLKGLDEMRELFPAVDTEHRAGEISISAITSAAIYEKLDGFAKSNGLTRSIVIMGSFILLLHRLTGRNPVRLLTTISGRNSGHYGQPDISGLIGYFANYLLVTNEVNDDTSMRAFLYEVQDNFLADLSHGEYPFEKLLRELPGLDTDLLFNSCAFYNYRDYYFLKSAAYKINDPAYNAGEGKEETTLTKSRFMQCPIGMSVEEYAHSLKINILFNSNVFSEAHAKDIFDIHRSVLQQILSSPL
jgi:amino acid adenylation domain-containing protein